MKKVYWNVFRIQNKKPWQMIGVAFINRDGSYNLRLRGNLTAADTLQMRHVRKKVNVKEQGTKLKVA